MMSTITEPVDPLINVHISLIEVQKAIDNAKKGKAYGNDAIPLKVLQKDTCIYCSIFASMRVLFQPCGVNV